jgi:Fe(3+) dicitrate transport protein
MILSWAASPLAGEPVTDSDSVATTDANEKEAEEQNGEEPASQSVHFERLRVIDRPEGKIPGSVSYLGREELERHQEADIHRVLTAVPGVIVQEEDGYGLRPNIGMRGSGSERSQKITLLEDGVLIAPAPYSAPAAYYFPTVARMEGIEVRKGSSSIRQGPFTNGGVLNLISSSIPSESSGMFRVMAGEDGTGRGRVRYGSSSDRFGWLVEGFRMKTDGFKNLDGGGDTGFALNDYLAKVRVNSSPGARMYQSLELKLSKTKQNGTETYLGLTDEDFATTPFRRYAGSQADRINTDHEQLQVRYMVRPGPGWDITATAYGSTFFRNWHKLQSVEERSIGGVLADPVSNVAQLAILRGEADSADDALMVRNNRRDYDSRGVQAVVGFHPLAGHDFELGLRAHRDDEDRFQEEDGYRMEDGRMISTSLGAPGSQSNRISSADALALFAQDTITVDRWTLTPGVRVERIDFERVDFGTDDPGRTGFERTRKSHEVDVVLPGFGASYALDRGASVFAGIHRGFAPPGAGVADDTDPEESLNYEIGYRRQGARIAGQAVAFYNDYDNLLGADTLSSGGTGSGDLFNGGQARVFGLETSLQTDLAGWLKLSTRIPLQLTYTHNDAEFSSSFESDFDAWGDVEQGDELPYLPEHQLALNAGWIHSGWDLHLTTSWVGRMRTVAGQGALPAAESTDSRWLVDISASRELGSGVVVELQVRNLTDEVYVVARRPAGVRPGLPRTVFAGFRWNF